MSTLSRRIDELTDLINRQHALEEGLLTEAATKAYAYEVCAALESVGYELPDVLTVSELAEGIEYIVENDSDLSEAERSLFKKAKSALIGAGYKAMKLLPKSMHKSMQAKFTKAANSAENAGDFKASAQFHRRAMFHFKHADPEAHVKAAEIVKGTTGSKLGSSKNLRLRQSLQRAMAKTMTALKSERDTEKRKEQARASALTIPGEGGPPKGPGTVNIRGKSAASAASSKPDEKTYVTRGGSEPKTQMVKGGSDSKTQVVKGGSDEPTIRVTGGSSKKTRTVKNPVKMQDRKQALGPSGTAIYGRKQ